VAAWQCDTCCWKWSCWQENTNKIKHHCSVPHVCITVQYQVKHNGSLFNATWKIVKVIHSFISGMHYYECVAPNVDIILQSGRRPHFPDVKPRTECRWNRKPVWLFPLCLEWRLIIFFSPDPVLVPQLGGSTAPLFPQQLEQIYGWLPVACIIIITSAPVHLLWWAQRHGTSCRRIYGH